MEAKFVVVGGKANKAEVKLKLPTVIGRSRDADLTVAHATVSRQHCVVYELDGALVVRDNNSLNGTFINEVKISEAVLAPDDQLTVGPLTFRAVYELAGPLPMLANQPTASLPQPETLLLPESGAPVAAENGVAQTSSQPAVTGESRKDDAAPIAAEAEAEAGPVTFGWLEDEDSANPAKATVGSAQPPEVGAPNFDELGSAPLDADAAAARAEDLAFLGAEEPAAPKPEPKKPSWAASEKKNASPKPAAKASDDDFMLIEENASPALEPTVHFENTEEDAPLDLGFPDEAGGGADLPDFLAEPASPKASAKKPPEAKLGASVKPNTVKAPAGSGDDIPFAAPKSAAPPKPAEKKPAEKKPAAQKAAPAKPAPAKPAAKSAKPAASNSDDMPNFEPAPAAKSAQPAAGADADLDDFFKDIGLK